MNSINIYDTISSHQEENINTADYCYVQLLVIV